MRVVGPRRSGRTFWREAFQDLRRSVRPSVWASRRNLQARYRDSIFGFLWVLIPPVGIALALSIGSGRAQRLETLPFEAIFGLTVIQIFLDGLFQTRNLLLERSACLQKYSWGLELALLTVFFECLFQALVRLLVLVVALLVFGVHPRPGGLLGGLAMLALGMGIGLGLAPLSALRRDLDHALALLPWILLGITPVFVNWTSNSKLHFLYRWNPMAWILQSLRAATYPAPGPPWLYLILFVLGPLSLLSGWLFCRACKPYVMERV